MTLYYLRRCAAWGALICCPLLIQMLWVNYPFHLPHFRPAPIVQKDTHTPQRKKVLIRRVKITAHRAKAPEAVVFSPNPLAPPKVEWQLRPLVQTYTYHFTGTIYCTNRPCTSEVQVFLDGELHGLVQKTVQSNAEGDYHVAVTVSERPDSQVDWILRIRTAANGFKEVQGRHILRDDTSITIDRPITIL